MSNAERNKLAMKKYVAAQGMFGLLTALGLIK